MSSSSLYRRLHGLFNLPRSSATKSNKPNPSPPSSATNKPNKSKSAASAASPLTAERRLQKLVNKFIKNSESDRFRARHGVYDSTVRRLAFHKKFSMIEDIIEAQKKYEDITDEGFAIRLIMLYGKAGMFTHARKLFDELPELNCERTVKSFNALLASCVNSKEYDQVETIFRDLPQEVSIEANVVSYNIVINAYCKMDALDKAILFFNSMEKSGMEPDLVTFNTLLAAYYRKGQFLDGENMWSMMENKNIAPNLISYNARLRGLIQENRMQEGIELLAEMEEKEIKPDVSSFNALIEGFYEAGNLEEAKKCYYSTYGHVLRLAEEIQKGAASVEGVEVKLWQVPETLPEEVLDKMQAPPKGEAPVITPNELAEADGLLFGFPTRFGMMCAQFKAFLDATGGLWRTQSLSGKPAGIFYSTACQGGGQETTALTAITQLVHHGMLFVPIGYTFGAGMFEMENIKGGSPYGAGTLAGDGSRQPSELELQQAFHQGKYFAGIAKKLKGN